MDEVLYLKFCQHRDLCTLFLNMYPAELVYVELGDPFWGDSAGSGMNQLGKVLMRVRERLRGNFGEYSLWPYQLWAIRSGVIHPRHSAVIMVDH